MVSTQTKPITEDELIRLMGQNDTRYEVVNGELVESMSAAYMTHAFIIDNIQTILKEVVKANNLGFVLGDGLTYKLDENAKGLKGTRIPDVSFIRHQRITSDTNFDQLFPGAPDLAVEVVSPTEGLETTLAKIRDYMAFGSEQAWVVLPDHQEVHVYKRDDPKNIGVYTADDLLEASNLFPDWEVQVREFFKLPYQTDEQT